MYLTIQPISMPMVTSNPSDVPVTATQIQMHSILTQLTTQVDCVVVSHYISLQSCTANLLYSQGLHF